MDWIVRVGHEIRRLRAPCCGAICRLLAFVTAGIAATSRIVTLIAGHRVLSLDPEGSKVDLKDFPGYLGISPAVSKHPRAGLPACRSQRANGLWNRQIKTKASLDIFGEVQCLRTAMLGTGQA